jgi:hypothetical protein
MSFSLCNAPVTFQAVMSKISQHLLSKEVLVNMDHIVSCDGLKVTSDKIQAIVS